MGYNPQESLENTINTMGTLLGVHPIVPWNNILAGFVPNKILYRVLGRKSRSERNDSSELMDVSSGYLVWIVTETNSSHLKRDHSKKESSLQTRIFHGIC